MAASPLLIAWGATYAALFAGPGNSCTGSTGWEIFMNRRKFYEPKEVAESLGAIARKKGFSQVRLSGNEPTLGMPHLLEVLSHLPEGLLSF